MGILNSRLVSFLVVIPIFFYIISCNNKLNCESPNSELHVYGKKYGYKPYNDYIAAKICALESDKPLLVLFTGIACVPTKHFPWPKLDNPEIRQVIQDDYVFAVLYIDDLRHVDEIEGFNRMNQAKTIGTHNSIFQEQKFMMSSFGNLFIVKGTEIQMYSGTFFEEDVQTKVLNFLHEGKL